MLIVSEKVQETLVPQVLDERRKSTRMSLENICELEANFEIFSSNAVFQDLVLDGDGVPQAREAHFAGVHHVEYVMEVTC